MFMTEDSYKLYTARQVRGIDYAAIHELGIAGYELMCRAGKAVVDVAQEHFPSSRHWLIMCGPGNNGGDGYVVARLAAGTGIKVSVCSLVDPGTLKGDAAVAYADWQKQGGDVARWPGLEEADFDLCLDALLGTGIDREVGGEYRDAIDYINHLGCPTLAIDIPSGLNADTGCPMGCAVDALDSVTFVGRKRGMYTADGPDICGLISFNDLDIPSIAGDKLPGQTGALLDSSLLTEMLKPRLLNSHKGSFGHVLAVGGSPGMAGAIRLCGEAALRSGAGRVTLVTDPAHAGFINLSRPELMVRTTRGESDWLSMPDTDFVIAVGPGLGGSTWSESLFRTCFESDAALVVDADGLNILARSNQPETRRRGNWILTPHPAEAGRLLGCEATEIQQDRISAAIRIAKDFNAIVVLKGCGSVIAEPGGEYAICPSGNPGMATAGSGDVLTGIIVALLGQRLSCFDAAKAGVLAHAEAGDLAAMETGEIGLIAGDIIDCLPWVWSSADL